MVTSDPACTVGGWFGAVTVTDRDVLPVAPSSSVTVSRTVYVPPAPYVCDGLWLLELPPPPKPQLQATTRPSGSLLASAKLQVSPEQLDVKAAVGDWFAGVTVTD